MALRDASGRLSCPAPPSYCTQLDILDKYDGKDREIGAKMQSTVKFRLPEVVKEHIFHSDEKVCGPCQGWCPSPFGFPHFTYTPRSAG